jgi:hypothetical protein
MGKSYFSKKIEFFNHYSRPHTYAEYSIKKILVWKIGVVRRLVGDARSNYRYLHVNLKKLNKVHKLKVAKPALICATGPSLNNLNIKFFKDFKKFGDIFSINYFPFTTLGKQLDIDYQVILDVDFFKELPIDNVEKNFRIWLRNVFRGKIITQIGAKCDYDNKLISIRGLTAPSFTNAIDPMKFFVGFPPYSTFYAISTAIWLGYSPIYIVGLDANQHKFIDVKENGVTLSDNHSDKFYPNLKFWSGRREVTSVLSSNAYVIEKLKLFKNFPVFIVGRGSHVDTLPKVSPSEVIIKHR